MGSSDVTAVARLLDDAETAYSDDAAAREVFAAHRARLREPLRVAIAGMVKAGKSTLLNALIGQEIAPTDAGECTTVVTWYQHGHAPRVSLDLRDGSTRALPVVRDHGRLRLDLGGVPADEVSRIVVEWPSPGLARATLIDTPGIASLSTDVSARSLDFLAPVDAPSEADAVVYLLRHLHASDLGFLTAFRDTAVGGSATVNAVAVLSRADEIGAGRIDSLLSAREIAERYRRDVSVRALALGVIPLAGLLAQSSRTLREAEFAALTEFANLERNDRERMLLSSDRFARETTLVSSTPSERVSLLQRFGLFGIRLATVLIASGATSAPDLAERLAKRSGLGELATFIDAQFHARADALKARSALVAVEHVLRERPRPAAGPIEAELERIQSSTHTYRELRLLATARTEGLPLDQRLALEAERLIGAEGVSHAARLAMPKDASAASIHSAAREALERWRNVLADPLTPRAANETCQLVVRSCEGILAEVAAEPERPVVRLRLAAQPSAARGQSGDEQRESG